MFCVIVYIFKIIFIFYNKIIIKWFFIEFCCMLINFFYFIFLICINFYCVWFCLYYGGKRKNVFCRNMIFLCYNFYNGIYNCKSIYYCWVNYINSKFYNSSWNNNYRSDNYNWIYNNISFDRVFNYNVVYIDVWFVFSCS